MARILKYGILEDIDTVRRIPVGRFWGITITIPSLTWLGPFIFFVLHFLLNLFNMELTPADRFHRSMIFVLAVEITTAFHTFGHILSGKLVNSSMDELLIATTRDVNLYHGDQSRVPGHVHLVRSVGGPLFNLAIAGFFIFLSNRSAPVISSNLLASLISTNLFFGIGSFLPLRSVDGEVIWREILHLFRARSQI